jgi:hypothetical protein
MKASKSQVNTAHQSISLTFQLGFIFWNGMLRVPLQQKSLLGAGDSFL